MPFNIQFDRPALDELREIRVFDRRRIEQAIAEQLAHEPTSRTRNRKLLIGVLSPLAGDLPLWELRVGEFRVLYHVAEDVVVIRAVRTKPPHQTTEQVV